MTAQEKLKTYAGRLLKSEWEVRPIALAVAQDMVKRLHYAKGGSNTAIACHGLFEIGRPSDVRGVAWWLAPTRAAAQATYPLDWQGVLALTRLVIEPDVPKNAATFLLSRSMKLLDRLRWPCLVTYADEWQGHTGTIYRACNWHYVGLTDPQPVWINEDGRLVAPKAGPKNRTNAEMEALGHRMIGRHQKHKFVHIAANAGARIERQANLFGEAA